MKWFKHYSNPLNPTSQLIDSIGLEGYARYYLILETVVLGVEELPAPEHATLSKNRWCSILKLKLQKLEIYLEAVQQLGLINYTSNGNLFTIEIPNLSKLISKAAISSDKRSTTSRPREDIDKNISVFKKIELYSDESQFNSEDPIITAAKQIRSSKGDLS